MVHHFTFIQKEGKADTVLFAVSKLGWSGVDLFFVLSGFLITKILIENRTAGRYFSAFYARRALRILPLYYAVLALTLYVLPRFMDLGALGGSSVWFWLHSSNVHFAMNGFSHKTLNIVWSLAIEEQFYLFWPFVVRWVAPARLPLVCVGMFVLSVGLRAVLGIADAPWVMSYVLTPARLDGLAVGGFIASAALDRRSDARTIGRVGALVSVPAVVAVLVLTRSTHMDGRFGPTVGYGALALLWGAVVLLGLASPLVNRVFRNRALTSLGKYSYALYLLHLPIALLLRDEVFPLQSWPSFRGTRVIAQVAFDLVAIGASFAAAWISWRVLEKPILSLKDRFTYQR